MMWNLILKSIRYNLSAHRSNLPNLVAGALGMLLNNFIFLFGMWGMLFAGKNQPEALLVYCVALNTLILLAWGCINFFFGGWIGLGELIVSGQFESKLSTPRHPLLLVSTHQMDPPALGDLAMGLMGLGYLFFSGHEAVALRTMFCTLFSFVGLFSVFVLGGSLAFFVSRGNVLAVLLREIVVSFSCYPMGKIFPSGRGRLLLLLTPAAAVSLLPMDWVERTTWIDFAYCALATVVTFLIAMGVYYTGVKRFQAVSVIGVQN